MRQANHKRQRTRSNRLAAATLALTAILTSACAQAQPPATTPAAKADPIAIYGNTTTFEIGPVLLAAEAYYPGDATVKMGSVANLVGAEGAGGGYSSAGIADVSTNAETQALRYSLRHPEMRIVMTVTEGLYRIVAKRSAGISTLADLKGKKIATISVTSSGYFTQKMLATVGLSSDDVTMVGMSLPDMPKALAEGRVDAVSIWEPEVERAAQAIGADAIEFSGKGVYRELFNLNTIAPNLADPVKRKKIVTFVRAIIDASAETRRDPTRTQQLVAKNSKYPLDLVKQSWSHHAFIANWTGDLLDVMAEEEQWLARQDKRTPRTREQLATLIDTSVLKEALALPPLKRK
jgi:NitT/TauT family transport system substrate-binding protein